MIDLWRKLYKRFGFPTILLLGSILRIIHISSPDLWRDEAFSVRAATQGFSNLIHILANDTAPPLHTVLLYLITELFGISEFVVRFPSFILGISSLVLIYTLSKKVLELEGSVLLVTLLASINPVLIQYSQEARNYALLLFLALAGLNTTIEIIESQDQWKNYIILSLTTVLGLYTHNLYLFIAFVNLLLILYFGWHSIREIFTSGQFVYTLRKSFIKKLLVSYLIAGVLYIPWFVILMDQINTVGEGGFWLQFNPIQDIFQTFAQFMTGEHYILSYSDFTFTWLSLYAFISVICILLSIKSIKNIWPIRVQRFEIINLWFWLNLIIVWVYSFKTSFFYVRYLIYLVPVALIIVIKQLSNIKHNSFRILIILILIITPLLMYVEYYDEIPESKARMTELVQNIDYKPGDLILHTNAYTHHAFNIYSDLDNQIYNPKNDLPYFEGLAVIEESDYYRKSEINDYDRVWVIYLWNPNETINRELEENYSRATEFDYDGNLHLDLWIKN